MTVHQFLGQVRIAGRRREVEPRTPGQRHQTHHHRADGRPAQRSTSASSATRATRHAHAAESSDSAKALAQSLPQRALHRERCPDPFHQFRRRIHPQIVLPQLRTNLTLLLISALALLATGQMTLEFERLGQTQFLVDITRQKFKRLFVIHHAS
jgi:hypothetical protein